jgi:hypothetical protein
MHEARVVLAGEDVAGAAHIGGELIDLVEAAVDNSAAKAWFAQVADEKVVGFAVCRACSIARR